MKPFRDFDSFAQIFHGSGNDFLMLSHPLSNFEVQNYYQN